MKRIRLVMMIVAVVIAVGGAFATNLNKKFFATAYVAASTTSCQLTTKPDICNTLGASFCTIQNSTFYQEISYVPYNHCVKEFRKF